MFYYISGTLALKTESFAVIDACGIGYKLYASTKTLETLGDVGSDAKLFTFTNFKASADIFDLYGFATLEELDLFEMIIGVSRVGAKTAIALLSNISPSKFALCVVTNDFKYIASKTPGLGAKGAERIVLELKDKFKGVDIGDISTDEVVDVYHGGDTESEEAVSALVVLGYSAQEAKRAVSGVKGSVEEIVKEALKKLMKG
ncbi:MAG: Holliday junction branch migration protein RuvA [Ruminococcaceae bacterium]|nr:Holliday junction branch migration protein RuvA [Oscillospiraceae bacterium]